MSITCISSPSQWARVNDTNRMYYKFSSTNYTQPNFQYQFNLKVYYADGLGVAVDLGTYNLHPATDGTIEFNPSSIYQNYLSYDIDLSKTGLTELTRTAAKFQLFCNEFYGTPPVKIVSGGWYESTLLNVYNGCQQTMPYDYTPLNINGNNKWVMNSGGVSGWTGQFLTDMTMFRLGPEDFLFLWALGPWTTGTTTGRPTKIRYNVYTGVGNLWFENPNTQSYEQSVPNASVKTSADEAPFSIKDYFFDVNTITWMILPSGGTIVDSQDLWSYVAVFPNGLVYTEVFKPGLPEPDGNTQHPTYYSLTRDELPVGTPTTGTTYYDENIRFLYANSLGYYFPCGPYNSLISGVTNWLYYDIDLISSGGTVMNIYPIRVINKGNCDKYNNWQLFWLNPHGGFDTYVFNKKVDVDYKIARQTYKRKLSPGYNSYDAGERVFNTDITEQLTLRTDLLTQRESQLLVQLTQSPVVYALKYYEYNSGKNFYTAPYIITSSDVKYEQKRNDKEITMEITLRPSNECILQKN